MNNTSNETRFVDVLDTELKLLKKTSEIDRQVRPSTPDGSKQASSYDRAYEANLCGLAFSGGGIRSATFNLGIIQGLAKKGLLGKFDYLSTVSGGGYIGCWLSAFLHRHIDGQDDSESVENIESRLTTHPCKDKPETCPDQSGYYDPATSGFPPVEHAAVRFLRGYSNFLTPRLGLSGDVLALVSLFLRNVVLLQLVVALFLGLVLLVPYALGSISSAIHVGPAGTPFELRTVLYLALAFMLYALYSCGRLLSERKRLEHAYGALQKVELDAVRGKQLDKIKSAKRHATRSVITRIILPFTFAVWLVITGIAGDDSMPTFLTSPYVWAACGSAAYVLVWAIGFALRRIRKPSEIVQSEMSSSPALMVSSDDQVQPLFSSDTGMTLAWLLGAAAIAGAVLGFLLFEGTSLIHSLVSVGETYIWTIVAFGPPVALLAVSFILTLHIGASRNAFDEQDREWWARLGGFVLITAAAWAGLFSIVIFSPPIVYWLGNDGIAAIVAWFSTSAIGAWMARNTSDVGSSASSAWKSVLVKIAPWIFVIGMLVILSCVVYAGVISYANLSLEWINEKLTLDEALRASADQQAALRLRHALHPILAALLFAALAARVFDINVFSAHSLYKNRLTRAYLGASRAGDRSAHPFTGFDPEDDIAFHELDQQRPIHVVNTTINMTGGDDLAWQTRRAASFAITPHFAGYQAKSTQGVRLGRYRPTSEFAGRIKLGTAMAISGAAASPNMGFHTSSSVAALLTAFNLRLGYWAGNPTADWQWREKSPRFAMRPILSEMTGSAKADSPWINLSDGGHFDNLGLYELIRRRCKMIIVTDVGCDPEHTLSDLANTLRKCWTDFGVHIDFDSLKNIYLKRKDKRYCGAQAILGKIIYPDKRKGRHDRETGQILYIKCSLTRAIHDKYPDIGQYADSHKSFPHETTIDQFFDENQFEAYRHLGFVAASEAIDKYRSKLRIVPSCRLLLFSGSSGTGKTMAAEEIARELDFKLFRIDMAQVVSKHIGETEKNLDRIFRKAERANVVLFFDEADALLGKRSDVKDSNDRYANLDTACFWQRLEHYSGVVILTTNSTKNLDKGFLHRFRRIVEFPMPENYKRRDLWQNEVDALKKRYGRS